MLTFITFSFHLTQKLCHKFCARVHFRSPHAPIHNTKAFALSLEAFTFTLYTNGRLLLSRYWLLISWMRPRVNWLEAQALCVCVCCGTKKSFLYSACASFACFPCLYFCFVYFSVVLCPGVLLYVCVSVSSGKEAQWQPTVETTGPTNFIVCAF